VSLPRSRILWALVGAGLIARVAVAFATYGHQFDVDSYALVRDALAADPLRIYGAVSFDLGGGVEQLRWPYPPAFFAWIALAGTLDGPLGLPFHGLIQLPAILADAAIAVLVYAFLRWRGADERLCLLAAGAVALGPIFAVVSGYHGQLDAVAIAPAVAALVVWELAPRRRALAAGLLIGLGAAVKTVPLLLVLALLPAARDRREALTLIIAAVAIPALLLAPFLAADPDGASAVLGYNGVPGVAGFSLVLQPSLAADWLTGAPPALSPASDWLFDLGGIPSLAALALLGLFLLRYRPSPVEGAVLVWLTVYAFSPNLFIHYAVWILPFLLLAGYVRAAIAVQAALLIPAICVYAIPWSSRDVALLYAPIVIGLWVASLAGLVVLVRRIIDSAPAPAPTRTGPRSG
jgi:hypothetical protein